MTSTKSKSNNLKYCKCQLEGQQIYTIFSNLDLHDWKGNALPRSLVSRPHMKNQKGAWSHLQTFLYVLIQHIMQQMRAYVITCLASYGINEQILLQTNLVKQEYVVA